MGGYGAYVEWNLIVFVFRTINRQQEQVFHAFLDDLLLHKAMP